MFATNSLASRLRQSPWHPHPYPERGEPLSLKGTPARSPLSSKPLPLLIKRKLGIVRRHKQIGPAIVIHVGRHHPNDLPGDFVMPDFSLTIRKRAIPLL